MSAELADGLSRPLGEAARSEVRERALSGARSFAILRIVTEIVAFASTVALARLIGPGDFGLAAVALILPAFAEILAYEGFASGLVQRPNATRGDAAAAAAVSNLFGIGFTVLVFFAAPLADIAFDHRVVGLIQLAGLAFVLSGISVVPQAILQRDLDFRTLSLVEGVGLVFGSATGVVLAAFGMDAAAIVLAQLARKAAMAVGFLALTPWVRPRFYRPAIPGVLRFGLPAALAGFFHAAVRNADYAIVGLKLDATQLGYYYRGYVVAVDYPGKATSILLRLAFPVMARADGLQDMFRIRARFARVQMAVIVPAVAAYVTIAPIVVPWIFGERWEPSVVPSQILGAVTIFGLLGSGNGPLLMATGKPRILLANNAAALVLLVATVWAAAPLGLVGLCVAVAVSQGVWAVGSLYVTLDRLLGLPIGPLVRELVQPTACALPGLLALLVTTTGDAHGALRALEGVGALVWAGGTYLALLRRFFPETWADVRMVIERVARRRKAPPLVVDPDIATV